MNKQVKEPALFDDDILNELEKTGIVVLRPICKHCCLKTIDLVTEKYPMISASMHYIEDGLYTLVIFLNMK